MNVERRMRDLRLFLIAAAAWAAMVLACATTGPQNGPPQPQPAAAAAETPRAGWQFLKTGMTPDEVYKELGRPGNVHVDLMYTLWFYSDQGDAGPHVQFDTRTMHVLRWRQ